MVKVTPKDSSWRGESKSAFSAKPRTSVQNNRCMIKTMSEVLSKNTPMLLMQGLNLSLLLFFLCSIVMESNHINYLYYEPLSPTGITGLRMSNRHPKKQQPYTAFVLSFHVYASQCDDVRWTMSLAVLGILRHNSSSRSIFVPSDHIFCVTLSELKISFFPSSWSATLSSAWCLGQGPSRLMNLSYNAERVMILHHIVPAPWTCWLYGDSNFWSVSWLVINFISK